MVKKVGVFIIFLLEIIIEKLHGCILYFVCESEKVDFTFQLGVQGFCNYAGLSMLDCEVLSHYFKSLYNQLK
jgi:hypothetical protein